MGHESTTDTLPRTELNLTASRMRPSVHWSDEAGAHSFELQGRALLGSSDHVPVRVHDRAVSRLHAELELRPDGVWVRDLGSRNGTFVNGVLCQAARVPERGQITVGATSLTIASGAEPRKVPLWPHDRFGELLARSEIMRELFVILARYAQSDAPVLIRGETGTGKELVAKALHDASERAEGPFVVVDCGALPDSLLESELFGHTRGAFTGAVHAREGAFESANGGTVFLDEIGELPLSMQPKLLRVLESLTVRRIGETAYRKIDVRFVSATHRDLGAMVSAGAFREDLFFRLSVLPAYIPPLSQRPEDIPLLLSHFLTRARVELPQAMLEQVSRHAWTGNVRELRSFAERCITMGPAQAWALTQGQDASASLRPPAPPALPPLPAGALPSVSIDVPFKELREAWVDHLEREYMRALAAKHGRNVATMADAAGLDRSYVHRLLRKHEI